MLRNKKNKTKFILVLLFFCTAHLWVNTVHSMGMVLQFALSYAAQMRIVAALVQQLPVSQSTSLSQQFLMDQLGSLNRHSIDQRNMAVPDLRGAYLPPLRCDAQEVQSKYQDQVVFMMQLSQKAQKAVMQKTVDVQKIHTVAAFAAKPFVAKAHLESVAVEQEIVKKVLEVQRSTFATAAQHMLTTKYAQENNWRIVSAPGSLKYVSPSGRASVEFRAIMPNSQAAFFEMQQQYAHSLREMKRFIINNADYKTAIQTQIKMAIDCMAQLNSVHPHERVLAIEQLSQLHISGPPDIYLRKTIDELLKGFIQSDGMIPECALLEQSNYCHGIIKRFIETIQSDLGDVLPIKKWGKSIDYRHFHNGRDFPISRAHNVGHGAREFVHLGYNYRALLNAHALHQARLACIKHAQGYNFLEVEKLMRMHRLDKVMESIHAHFLNEFQMKVAREQRVVADVKNALFDQYGFYRSCANNPWLLTMPEQDKVQYAVSPEKLALVNNHLLAQAAIKDELMKRWHIPEAAPAKVHQMVYVIMGEQAQNLHNPVAMIDIICDLAHAEPETAHYFFLPNGVFKDFAQTKRAQSLPAWPELLKPENTETRRALNYLMYLEECAPGSRVAERAHNGLDKYQAADLSQPVKTIDKIFQRSLSEMLYDKMKEQRVYKVEDLQKKVAEQKSETKNAFPDVDVAQSVELFRNAFRQSELQLACSAPAQPSNPDEASICKTKKEIVPEFSCGSSKAHAEDYAEPKETCKTVGNDVNDPLKNDGQCITGQAPPQDLQCNHSKGALPSFHGEVISHENLPVIIAPDAALKDLTQKEAEAVEKAAREIEKAVQEKSQEWVKDPAVQKAIKKDQLSKKQKKAELCEQHQVVIYGGKHLHVPDDLKEIITKPEDWELDTIFDGALLTPAQLGEQVAAWVDYQHLLCPIIKVNCKEKTMIFTGFHHDYLGKIKECGLIEYTNVVEHADGFWEAKWKYKNGNGMPKISGFFPNDWTPVQVMKSILEASRNIKKDTQRFSKGSWSVIGRLQSGQEILIVYQVDSPLNQVFTGKIITVYPIFERISS